MRGHPSAFRQRLLFAGAAGLTLGALAGIGECLYIVLVARGLDFRLVLLLYALIIDGGVGLLLGVMAGLVWQGATYVRRRVRGSRPAAVPTANAAPGVRITLVWRSMPQTPQTIPQAPVVTRRTALRLGMVAASAGALGLGALAWSSRVRQPGASTAYAYNPVADPAVNNAVQLPNVLLITLDTLRADQLGAYGNTTVKTPGLDKLASQGARFDLHLIQEPQTNPSHGCMFTGVYPSSSGVRIHMVDKLPNNLESLAGAFSAAGYATAGLYSWMSFDPQYCGFDRGFQSYQNVSGAAPGALDNPALAQLAAQYRVAEQYLALAKAASEKVGVQQELEGSAKGQADITTNAAIGQLQMFVGKPFFLWLHYFDPHYPYVPPAPYDTQYGGPYSGKLMFGIDTIHAIEQGTLQPGPDDIKRLLGLYQGEISFMDSHLGRLFEALDRMGLAGNTIVAVTGDHGESFGEHSDLVEAPDYFHPHNLFNSEARTPLLLRYPGHIKPGAVVGAPTQAVDLFPTLLGLAGLKTPDQSQGASLVPLLDGSDSGATRVAYSAMQDYAFTAVTVPGWKYIRNNTDGSGKVYDLSADPGETHDASAAHPALLKQLDAKAQAWMQVVHIS